MQSSNMQLWDSVCKTDPNYTKQVNQRGGFTAIDAQYQVMLATQTFGAVGKGWGYDAEHSVLTINGKSLACVDLKLWYHIDGERCEYGPIRTTQSYGDGRIDEDAPKKALTNALTKALSQLGFNADVFLGKFDDNHYVQARYQEVQQEQQQVQTQQVPLITGDQIDDIEGLLDVVYGHEAEAKKQEVLTAAKVSRIEDIPASTATAWINKLIERRQAKEANSNA